MGKITHGMNRTPLHKVWRGMLVRCYTPSSTSYPRYGGRGIGVCPEWRHDFAQFYADMSTTWRQGLTLERSDSSADYSAGNCTWATYAEQAVNRRNNVTGVIRGVAYVLSEAVEKFGAVKYKTAHYRVKHGWSFSEAVLTPSRSR